MPEIRAALASLPKEQRAAVVYRDVLGLSYGETAEQMGKSVNAVTMLLHRGRQAAPPDARCHGRRSRVVALAEAVRDAAGGGCEGRSRSRRSPPVSRPQVSWLRG